MDRASTQCTPSPTTGDSRRAQSLSENGVRCRLSLGFRSAVQEVRSILSALDRVIGLLGRWWKYVVTDVTEGESGNGERMAFVYDSRKVAFGGLAGDIILPPEKVYTEVLQFARTPVRRGFKAGWARIDLCTVHIYYGKGVRIDSRGLEEIRKLAKSRAT